MVLTKQEKDILRMELDSINYRIEQIYSIKYNAISIIQKMDHKLSIEISNIKTIESKLKE